MQFIEKEKHNSENENKDICHSGVGYGYLVLILGIPDFCKTWIDVLFEHIAIFIEQFYILQDFFFFFFKDHVVITSNKTRSVCEILY